MKKWICRIAILACMIAVLAAIAGCHVYRQLMDDVLIVQYFDSVADNLDWHTVYIRAVVPENEYKEGWTVNAIRAYVIIRSKNIPTRIDLVIYNSMEDLKECNEYAKASFKK